MFSRHKCISKDRLSLKCCTGALLSGSDGHAVVFSVLINLVSQMVMVLSRYVANETRLVALIRLCASGQSTELTVRDVVQDTLPS